jgi:hypothetical protein
MSNTNLGKVTSREQGDETSGSNKAGSLLASE